MSENKEVIIFSLPQTKHQVVLSPAVIKKIANFILEGNTIKNAAILAGIDKNVFSEWVKKGTQDIKNNHQSIEARLKRSIDLAVAQVESQALSVIKKASEKNWTAAAWYLERLNPKKWGRKKPVAPKEKKNEQIKVVSFIEALRPPMEKEEEGDFGE